MLTLDRIPAEFKIICNDSFLLRVRFCQRLHTQIAMALMFLPFVISYAINIACLLLMFVEMFHLGFFSVIERLFQLMSENWLMAIACLLWFLLGVPILGAVVFELFFNYFGTTIVRATPESLALTHQFVGINRKICIPAYSIEYFNHYFHPDSESNDWILEVAIDQNLDNREQLNSKKIFLNTSGNDRNGAWLGKILSDFYEVEFTSETNRVRSQAK